jgi:hypothetical protein
MHDVKTCDPLPSGLAYVSSNPKATLESGLFCWTEPALAPHSSVVYKVVARALRVSHHRLVNRAWVTAREYPRKLYADAHVIVVAPKPPPPPITG